MKKVLYVLLLAALTAPLLSAQRYGYGHGYSYRHGGRAHYGYRSLPSRHFRGSIPYGYGFRAGYGYHRGFRGYYGGSRYGYGYRPYYGRSHYGGSGYGYGYGYRPRPYAANYYRPYYRSTTGSYAVYLGPSIASPVVRANYSEVLFDVTPPRALVYVDGNLIGSASSFSRERDRYPIMEGEHQLRIVHPGYQPFEATLQVVPDRDLRIDVQLER